MIVISLVLGELKAVAWASSSASIFSSREVLCLFNVFFMGLVGAEGVVALIGEVVGRGGAETIALSKRGASFGKDIAFSCLPKFRIVS